FKAVALASEFRRNFLISLVSSLENIFFLTFQFTLGITLLILLFSLISPIDALTPPISSDFCKSLKGVPELTGTQVASGFCSSQIMGQIPSNDHMPSTLILLPPNEATFIANQTFSVTVKITNLVTGYISNPLSDYYLSPQTLNDDGVVLGHSHIVVQLLTSESTDAPDAKTFAFFEGLSDPFTNGVFSQEVPGLPAGRYRICTLSSTYTHQLVIMPVAQRGAQDDCIRITVQPNSSYFDNQK
ncbi:10876_t:CDS:2, partial [Racocetra persica]